MPYRFEQVDVFTDKRFAGNPLAVFTDAAGLTPEQMQLIAREMNLSETTFILPAKRPDCVAYYHIFTPARELPFAGHPTIGTAFVLAREGRVPDGNTPFKLETGVGAVTVRREGEARNPKALFFTSPEVVFGRTYEDRARVAESLALRESDLLPEAPVQQVGCPVFHLHVGVKTPQLVDAVSMNGPMLERVLDDGATDAVYIFAPAGPGRFYARLLGFERVGIVEDPATGSAASPHGAYAVRYGLVAGGDDISISIEQGTKMGRQSFLSVRVLRNGQAVRSIEVGGSAVPVLTGELSV